MSVIRSALAYAVGIVATVFALIAIMFGVLAGAIGHIAGLLVSHPAASAVNRMGAKSHIDMKLT